jgi:hypothetical protein
MMCMGRKERGKQLLSFFVCLEIIKLKASPKHGSKRIRAFIN